jgi:hypothetical protein
VCVGWGGVVGEWVRGRLPVGAQVGGPGAAGARPEPKSHRSRPSSTRQLAAPAPHAPARSATTPPLCGRSYAWTTDAAAELAAVAFYTWVGTAFRPAANNAYFK